VSYETERQGERNDGERQSEISESENDE